MRRDRRLRRRQPALAVGGSDRAGAEPVVTTDPATAREAPLGADRRRRPRRERRGAGSPPTASTTPCASASRPGRPVAGICVGLQLLFEQSEEGGAGLGLLAGPVRRLRARRVPHMGWNALAPARPSADPRRPRGRGRLLRAQLRRRAGGRATSRSRRSTTTARSSRRSSPAPLAGVQFHPERSAAAGARVLENLAAMVKKRVIPCLDVAGGRVVKGVRFENLREMGDPVELATRYSELGADELVFLDITATLEGRGPILDVIGALRRRARRSRSPQAAASPASRMRARCCWPAPTRSRSTARRSTTRRC